MNLKPRQLAAAAALAGLLSVGGVSVAMAQTSTTEQDPASPSEGDSMTPDDESRADAEREGCDDSTESQGSDDSSSTEGS
jgi:hypothetical protein